MATIFEYLIKTPLIQEAQDNLALNPYTQTRQKEKTLEEEIFEDDEIEIEFDDSVY
jgi:hypothetical protein